ncbi:MAG: ribosomal protein S18-alanine N-acetyltransferase [Streptococcaceae bacterium]|jgi:ribosomal-protein-alanine N-acetyltransferase|nr:ribosomal protein S18-alanine N-acetyltransferase [Streptococcaceae bacterium]
MRIVDNCLITDNEQLASEIYKILSSCYLKSPWSIQQILSDIEIPENLYFLAYDDKNLLIGFMATQAIIDEMEITNIAVLPNYRRQGVAQSLFNQVSEFCGTLFLEVREGNKAAQKLYEKFGFVEFNRRKHYYTNPMEDALLFKKEQNS